MKVTDISDQGRSSIGYKSSQNSFKMAISQSANNSGVNFSTVNNSNNA